MPSFNRIVLCGNLTADPESSYTPAGLAITKFRLAVNESVKNQATGEWTERPCYINISTFGRQAETCAQYLSKGSPVLLEGRLRYETWDAKDGTKRSAHSVAADRVQFLGTRAAGEAGGTEDGPGAPVSPAPAAPRAPARPPLPPIPADAGDDENLPF
jgi:single-strand DNA-binding protein